MFNPRQWLDECERALDDADYLAGRLARTAQAGSSADITALRIRISALRAEFERARIAMDMPRGGGGADASEVDDGAQSPWPSAGPSRRLRSW
jgi:hypothetical protein